MYQYYLNPSPQGSEYIHTNTTQEAQNLLLTLTGGDGALSKSTWIQSDWTKYWQAGAKGVSAQVYINDVLIDFAQGGAGNPQTMNDVKKQTGTEAYTCGRYWWGGVKWCDRAVYGWSNLNKKIARAGSGESKSFCVNLPPNGVLKVVFAGSANIKNTLFDGSVSISLIPINPPTTPPSVPSTPPTPPSQGGDTDTDSDPTPPSVDNAQGENSSGDTQITPPENNGEPTPPDENTTPTPPQTDSETTPPLSEEEKQKRKEEIRSNALVEEFLSFKEFVELLISDEVLNKMTDPNYNIVAAWFKVWILNPLNTAKLEDLPASGKNPTMDNEAASLALAKWVLKIEGLDEIFATLQGEGLTFNLDEFKVALICFFNAANQAKDSFENERNRYVEIYAMPEIRVLIDEYLSLEAEVA